MTLNDSHPTAQQLAELADSTRWAQALASRLVGDRHLAEDVVQDAWLASLRRPSGVGSPRAWFAGAVRNLAMGERRERARRRAREVVAARGEALPGAGDVAARLEGQRVLIAALLGIDEPFRGALVARYVDGLAPSEIAARDGVPVSTVNGRLARGLKRLRTELERRPGGGSTAWVGALLPLVPRLAGEQAAGAYAGAGVTAGAVLKGASVVVFAVGSAVGLGVLALTRFGASDAAASMVAAPVGGNSLAVSEPALVSLVGVAASRPSDRNGRSRAVAAPAAREADSESDSDQQALLRVEGRVAIRDSGRGDLLTESGRFYVRSVASGPASEPVMVPFVEGRFVLEGRLGDQVLVERATTSGAEGSAEGERSVAFELAEFDLREGESLLLHGHYLQPVSLRVVDAETGLDLERVNVMPRAPHHGGAAQSHPGPHNGSSFMVLGEPSPLRLPASRGIQSFWVTAADYSWAFVQVQHEAGGERIVALEPAGSLAVQLVGPMEELPSDLYEIHMRVYHRETGRLATSALVNDGGRQGFGGLPAGPYDVRVEVGSATQECRVLGTAEAEVLAREHSTTVEVPFSGVPLRPKVHVLGRVVLPPALAGSDFALTIAPADGVSLRPGDVQRIPSGDMEGEHGKLDWNAEELTVGRYQLGIQPFGYTVEVEIQEVVGPSSPEVLVVQVPELARVQVVVVDSLTGAPVPEATIRWSRVAGEEGVGASVPVLAGQPTGLHLASGSVTLTATSPRHGSRSRTVLVPTGVAEATEVLLELPPAFSRELVLISGDTVIPWPEGAKCTFTQTQAGIRPRARPHGPGRMRGVFEESGSYDVTITGVGAADTGQVLRIEVREESCARIQISIPGHL